MKTQILEFYHQDSGKLYFVTLTYVSFDEVNLLHDLWIRHSEIQLNTETETDRLLSKETVLCPVSSMAQTEQVCASIQD